MINYIKQLFIRKKKEVTISNSTRVVRPIYTCRLGTANTISFSKEFLEVANPKKYHYLQPIFNDDLTKVYIKFVPNKKTGKVRTFTILDYDNKQYPMSCNLQTFFANYKISAPQVITTYRLTKENNLYRINLNVPLKTTKEKQS